MPGHLLPLRRPAYQASPQGNHRYPITADKIFFIDIDLTNDEHASHEFANADPYADDNLEMTSQICTLAKTIHMISQIQIRMPTAILTSQICSMTRMLHTHLAIWHHGKPCVHNGIGNN